MKIYYYKNKSILTSVNDWFVWLHIIFFFSTGWMGHPDLDYHGIWSTQPKWLLWGLTCILNQVNPNSPWDGSDSSSKSLPCWWSWDEKLGKHLAMFSNMWKIINLQQVGKSPAQRKRAELWEGRAWNLRTHLSLRWDPPHLF